MTISNNQLNELWLKCTREGPLDCFQLPCSFAQRYGLDPDTAVSLP
jgi:hypothetical protein